MSLDTNVLARAEAAVKSGSSPEFHKLSETDGQRGKATVTGLDKDLLDKAESAIKSAEGPYGMSNIGVQSYVPVQKKRKKESPEEQANIERGLSKWLPKIWQSYSTPAWQMLASPGKQSLLTGLGGGGLGALIGAGLGSKISRRDPGATGVGAGIGGGAGALIAGLLGYFARRQENENILEILKRLPPGATKRDILSDPAYQADLYRNTVSSSRGPGYGLIFDVGSY